MNLKYLTPFLSLSLSLSYLKEATVLWKAAGNMIEVEMESWLRQRSGTFQMLISICLPVTRFMTFSPWQTI